MNVPAIMFYFFESIAALSAIGLVFIRHVFYGALLLMACLLSVAGIYVLAFAEFVAVTQILVYTGGVLVVIIFGVMLTTKISGKPLVVKHTNVWTGAFAAITFCLLLMYLMSRQVFSPIKLREQNKEMETIGISLMSDFVLPFEVAGLLLLAALIGASVIASVIKSKKMS
jgi:NADH-quinone oxidoreductase subunit J